MPDIENTQIQTATQSNDGTNVVPILQANSHFFLEGAFNQTSAQAFGVFSDKKFRTTATVSANGKKIYAICQGQIFVQPQKDDTSKINIILRPFKQPINGLSIKYFIYRGLKKSDLITDGNIIQERSTTGLTTFLWKEFDKFYESDDDTTVSTSPPTFQASFIGYPESLDQQKDENLLDFYFYKITQTIDNDTGEEDAEFAYELPIIPKGTHLGNVEETIGIDIVLNKGDYYIENDTNPFQLNLAFARLKAGVIDTTGEANAYKTKLLKEACTQFIDLAAFYGLHANGAGTLFYEEVEEPKTKKEDIYEKLTGFDTRHNFYLYLQANRQRSYNFYDNYMHPEANKNIKVGTTKDSLEDTLFGTDGWPVQVFDKKQEDTENNNFWIQLVTDNHEGAGLFVQLGNLVSSHEQNFVRGTNLLQNVSTEVGIDNNYTKPINLITPSKNEFTIASIAQLVYEGKQIMVTEEGNEERFLLKDIDDVFGLLDAKALNTPQNEDDLPTIIEERIQLINFPLRDNRLDIGAIRYKKIEDKIHTREETFLARVTYETLISAIQQNDSPYVKSSSTSIDNESANMQEHDKSLNNFYQPAPPYQFTTEVFMDSGTAINGIKLSVEGNAIPSKKILGITKEEYEVLRTIVATKSLINGKLFFRDNLENPEDSYASNEGINYKIYRLCIIAEDSKGETKIFIPRLNITIYTIGKFLYFSKEYSEFLKRDGSTDVELPIFKIYKQ